MADPALVRATEAVLMAISSADTASFDSAWYSVFEDTIGEGLTGDQLAKWATNTLRDQISLGAVLLLRLAEETHKDRRPRTPQQIVEEILDSDPR